MQLVTIPNEILGEICSEVLPEEIPEYGDIAGRMIELMAESDGIGLAAPQVGLSKRVIVFYGEIDEGHHGEPVVMINPEVIEASGELVVGIEGCLSVPVFRIPVQRPSHVCVSAFDSNGARFDYRADDYVARCILHEIDHLNGITLLDHLNDDIEDKFVVIPKSVVGLEESDDDEFPFLCIEVEDKDQAMKLYDELEDMKESIASIRQSILEIDCQDQCAAPE